MNRKWISSCVRDGAKAFADEAQEELDILVTALADELNIDGGVAWIAFESVAYGEKLDVTVDSLLEIAEAVEDCLEDWG